MMRIQSFSGVMMSDENAEKGGGSRPNPIVFAIMIIVAGALLFLAMKSIVGTGGQTVINVANLTGSQLPNHIDVYGEAKRSVQPDLMTISFSVRTLNATAKASQEENAARMSSVKDALKGAGVKDADIETVSYDIYPEYASEWLCPGGAAFCDDKTRTYNQTLSGYRTIHSVSANIYNISSGGAITDLIISSGAETIDSMQFSLKDSTRNSVELALLQNASEAAKAKAENIAAGIGATLGRPLSASSGYYYYPTYQANYNRASIDAASAQATPISPGQVDVYASVSVSYGMS
jgi:uncharacterized protein YggE